MRSRPKKLLSGLGAVGLIVVVALLVWGSWQLLGTGGAGALKNAGSAQVAEPISPLRLVAAMAPPGVDDEPSYGVDEIVSYSDAEIHSAITAKLEEMQLPVEPLTIEVQDHHVELDGPVADALLRDAIEITIRAVPGVRTVENRLNVVKAE